MCWTVSEWVYVNVTRSRSFYPNVGRYNAPPHGDLTQKQGLILESLYLMNIRWSFAGSSRRWLDTLLARGTPWPLRLLWYLGLSSFFGLLVAWLAQSVLIPVARPVPPELRAVQAPAGPLPVEPTSLTATAVPAPTPPTVGGKVLTVNGFGELSPADVEMGWQAAARHCAGQGLRLPSVAALQALWQQQTQGRPSNAELCAKAGWPLGKLCGGTAEQAEYWSRDQQQGYPQVVSLFNGLARVRDAEAPLQLACIDEGGAP